MSQLTANLTYQAGMRPRVVIIGGGFAGINAAQAMRKLPVDVTVIDRRNHHTFQPLLYQVALAVLSPAQIAQPIRTVLKKNENTEVLMDEVTSIDKDARIVKLASGALVAYDYLVLATGRRIRTLGMMSGLVLHRASRRSRMLSRFVVGFYFRLSWPSGTCWSMAGIRR